MAAYLDHDAVYKTLKERGFDGWGAEQLPARIEGWRKRFPRIVERLEPPQNLLEIGCGAGQLSIEFAKLGFHVTGIDASETAVNWAIDNARIAGVQANTDFQTVDLANSALPLKGGFNAIIDGNCLHCILPPHRKVVLRNLFDLLSYGGFLYVSSICTNEDEDSKIESTEVFAQSSDATPLLRFVSHPQALLQELRNSGFEIEWSEVSKRDKHCHLSAIAIKN